MNKERHTNFNVLCVSIALEMFSENFEKLFFDKQVKFVNGLGFGCLVEVAGRIEVNMTLFLY
jgi:hypothetical protein